jgi:hypothetical protein
MNNSYPSQIVFNPYAAINPRHLSSLALCWEGNRLSGCNNFTPNAKINAYSSSVFHGQSGPGVRSIPMATYHQQQLLPPQQQLIPGVPTPPQQQLIPGVPTPSPAATHSRGSYPSPAATHSRGSYPSPAATHSRGSSPFHGSWIGPDMRDVPRSNLRARTRMQGAGRAGGGRRLPGVQPASKSRDVARCRRYEHGSVHPATHSRGSSPAAASLPGVLRQPGPAAKLPGRRGVPCGRGVLHVVEGL